MTSADSKAHRNNTSARSGPLEQPLFLFTNSFEFVSTLITGARDRSVNIVGLGRVDQECGT
jgi:hypothetical protein